MHNDPRFRDTEPLSRLDPSTFRSDHFHAVHGGNPRLAYPPRHAAPVALRLPWWRRLLRRPR